MTDDLTRARANVLAAVNEIVHVAREGPPHAADPRRLPDALDALVTAAKASACEEAAGEMRTPLKYGGPGEFVSGYATGDKNVSDWLRSRAASIRSGT